MASDDDTSPTENWWQTIPGVITAVAALITAVGGILAIMFQYGVVGGSEAQSTTPPGATGRTSPPGSNGLESVVNGRPWSEATASIIARDGTKTSVRAETVRYCISVGEGLTLSTGQEIAFEKMESVEVLRSDDQFVPDGKADVMLTLVGGQRLKGGIGSGCDFFGFNDAGRFSIYPQHLQRITFTR